MQSTAGIWKPSSTPFTEQDRTFCGCSVSAPHWIPCVCGNLQLFPVLAWTTVLRELEDNSSCKPRSGGLWWTAPIGGSECSIFKDTGELLGEKHFWEALSFLVALKNKTKQRSQSTLLWSFHVKLVSEGSGTESPGLQSQKFPSGGPVNHCHPQNVNDLIYAGNKCWVLGPVA